jgi:hypothetical protein
MGLPGMSELLTELKPVQKPPLNIQMDTRVVDAILDSFIVRDDKIRKVLINGTPANHLKTEFERRIEDRYLDGIIRTEILNRILYLKK